MDTSNLSHSVLEEITSLLGNYHHEYGGIKEIDDLIDDKVINLVAESLKVKKGIEVTTEQVYLVLSRFLSQAAQCKYSELEQEALWGFVLNNTQDFSLASFEAMEKEIMGFNLTKKKSLKIEFIGYGLVALGLVLFSVGAYHLKDIEFKTRHHYEEYWLKEGKLYSCNYLLEKRAGTKPEVTACLLERDKEWRKFKDKYGIN